MRLYFKDNILGRLLNDCLLKVQTDIDCKFLNIVFKVNK